MLLGFLVALLSLPGAYGQNTSVSCSNTHDWMRNSKGQSPCLITAWLQYPCIGSYDVGQPIYLGPVNGDVKPCACSTVLYSTLAACAVCQGVGLDGIVPWSVFSQHCLSVATQQYPELVPNDTSIPPWAYLPLFNDTFDVRAAQFLAFLDSTGSSPNSTTSSTSVPDTNATPASGSASSLSSSDARNESSPLIGMLVGGTLLLTMAIASTIVSARRFRALSMPPQTPALLLPPRAARMPVLRMPDLRMPALRMPARPRMPTLRVPVFKLRMPAAVGMPTWRRRGHDSEASWTIGTPSKHDVFSDPDDPPVFPPLPSPADVYFYRCHKKALDVLGCKRPRSYTDVSVAGGQTSTVGTMESCDLSTPPTVPLRSYNYHWRHEGAV
ncbi:hypothetical protein LXA43DRAFT_704222 [Ganoderma leucocontextum]|nr:hypothetical protein LXA43DRAFT_704222 [Ganoderma leucocontextum]